MHSYPGPDLWSIIQIGIAERSNLNSPGCNPGYINAGKTTTEWVNRIARFAPLEGWTSPWQLILITCR